MKMDTTPKTITLDTAGLRRVDREVCSFLGETRLEEMFATGLSVGSIVRECPAAERSEQESEDLDDRQDQRQTFGQPAFDSFERDPVACYLKEVAQYPLLTRERELELATTLREGQNRLTELVARHAPEAPLIERLDEKIRRLLSREKAFPGVRDKALRLIRVTLERLVHEHPEHPLYLAMLSEVAAITATINNAKQEMIKANLRLVLSIARRYRGRGMSFDDLIQEGNLGLLTAVGRFDHTRGTRFSTYATHWVRQSIIRGIYVKTRTIRLPVHFVEMKNRFFKVFYELLKELGREPTPQEIAARTQLSVQKMQQVLSLSLQPVSLDSPIGDRGQPLGDLIEDQHTPSPVNHCAHGELTAAIRQLLANLNPREEEVIRMRFGLEGQPAETLERIGRSFNVSKERIRQIEKKAMEKLRKLNHHGHLAECRD